MYAASACFKWAVKGRRGVDSAAAIDASISLPQKPILLKNKRTDSLSQTQDKTPPWLEPPLVLHFPSDNYLVTFVLANLSRSNITSIPQWIVSTGG